MGALAANPEEPVRPPRGCLVGRRMPPPLPPPLLLLLLRLRLRLHLLLL